MMILIKRVRLMKYFDYNLIPDYLLNNRLYLKIPNTGQYPTNLIFYIIIP